MLTYKGFTRMCHIAGQHLQRSILLHTQAHSAHQRAWCCTGLLPGALKPGSEDMVCAVCR